MRGFGDDEAIFPFIFRNKIQSMRKQKTQLLSGAAALSIIELLQVVADALHRLLHPLQAHLQSGKVRRPLKLAELPRNLLLQRADRWNRNHRVFPLRLDVFLDDLGQFPSSSTLDLAVLADSVDFCL